jgi:hypothetical protein
MHRRYIVPSGAVVPLSAGDAEGEFSEMGGRFTWIDKSEIDALLRITTTVT